MVNLYLIRHGEAEITEEGKSVITKKGISQAKKLGKRLSKIRFDRIITSTSYRALETAKEIKKYHKTKLIERADLKEIYVVIIGGKPKSFERKERLKDDFIRANKLWKEMLNWKYKNVAVVCHGNIIRFFLSKAIGFNPKISYKLIIDHSSVSKILIKNKEIRVLSINNITHLENNSSKGL